ncbi:hypothetical protein UFOVP97_16 [uncultured Caudovirales phage]|uniref:Uncharacterized protein n=1 Tax=uncultured Caudovirales phage TaxID=2100421 RepID=A0A6J5L774_9CAUD|nr:hypothetical protein UFOVP97_16 [uncultured Caudovirales phage]CAB4134244.1 hypothetical protein UFOVP268_34 [uncultured Caudovirales phage]
MEEKKVSIGEWVNSSKNQYFIDNVYFFSTYRSFHKHSLGTDYDKKLVTKQADFIMKEFPNMIAVAPKEFIQDLAEYISK